MSQMFVKIKDQQYGPYSSTELEQMVEKGQFQSDDLVFNENSQEWVRASESNELREFFSEEEEQAFQQQVLAVGGGKGGVGKTVTTASLGVGLAALGYKVVVVDADLGGANLHTCMGILEPRYTFYHFYTLQRDSLEDIMLETPVKNLKLISGACGTLGLANPRFSQKLRFISNLKNINADYIILDLGAGSSYNVIDFFIAADQGLVVTSPEPMAIQETFNFIKVAVFRKIQRHFRQNAKISALFDRDVFAEIGRMGDSMSQLLEEIGKIDKNAGKQVEEILESFNPKLILNMVHENEDVKEGAALKTAVKELLSLNMDYLGYLEYDENVRYSVKELKPFIINNPKSKASKSLAKLITVGLLRKSGWKGLRERRKVSRQIHDEANSYPTNQLKESDMICSVRCFYWGDCDFQNGGFPCPVRHLDPIFHR